MPILSMTKHNTTGETEMNIDLWTPPASDQSLTLRIDDDGLERTLTFDPLGEMTLPKHLTNLAVDVPVSVWTRKKFTILFGQEPTKHGNLWHLSISHKDRDPEWPVIKAAKMACFPADMDVMMVLPAQDDYVNLHPHCFHLWECPEKWDML